jgi:hypothetical protein
MFAQRLHKIIAFQCLNQKTAVAAASTPSFGTCAVVTFQWIKQQLKADHVR